MQCQGVRGAEGNLYNPPEPNQPWLGRQFPAIQMGFGARTSSETRGGLPAFGL
jgi:hypothetical protein